MIFLLLFSCKKEIKKTIFVESHLNTDNDTSLIHINIPLAKENQTNSNNINSAIKRLITSALKLDNTDNKTEITISESIESFETDFKTFKIDFPESLEQWEAQIDGEILFQSTEIITIAITIYINTGGAHGSLKISLLNFNAENGQNLETANLFNDINEFKEIAKPYYEKAINAEEIFDNSKPFNLSENIGYSEEGILLLYNTSERTLYPSKIIEFTVPFEKANSALIFNSTL